MFQVKFGVRQVSSPFFAIYLYELAQSYLALQGSYIVLYTDDILILSPSIRQLEVTLRNCELEMDALDMAVNFKKLSCMRVGPMMFYVHQYVLPVGLHFRG